MIKATISADTVTVKVIPETEVGDTLVDVGTEKLVH